MICLLDKVDLYQRGFQLLRLSLLGLLFSQLFLTTAIAADKPEDKSVETSEDTSSDEKKSTVFSDMTSIVDETHGKVSDGFSSFVVQIDDFIASGEGEQSPNTSWARIRLDAVKPGGEKIKLAPRVKVRIVLPQSQRRFRLLVSTEDEESSASNTDAAQRGAIATTDTNDFALALRFVRTVKERLSLKFDVGARYRDKKAQIFGRFGAGYRRDSMFGITNRFNNRFTLFSASGYENVFSIDSRRLLFGREDLYFRNAFNASWRKGLKGAGIGEVFGLYYDLSKRKALAFEAITGYTTSLNEEAIDKYLGVELRTRYRHNIWRPWFHYEVWPSVSWSSSNDYERAFGGRVRIEVALGRIN